jgi:hypothetical protein
MKKVGFLLSFLFLTGIHLMSQAWTVYNGNELPTESTPAFVAGDNSPDASFVAEVIADPDSAGNKLFKYDHPVIEGKQTYKMEWEIGTGTAATIIARIKGIAGTNSNRVAEIDVRNSTSGIGSKLQIRYDDTIQLESPAVSAFLEKTSEWHIYRFVMNGADFTVYVDEKPTPVLSGTSTKARTDNWFKFGDQSANFSHSGLFDYIIWDVTGAYAPGQGAPIPDTLSKHYYGEQTNKIIEISSDKPVIFPNPSKGEIKITASAEWINTEFLIVNSLGQLVQNGIINERNTILKTDNLAEGSYTLIIQSGEKKLYSQPFIHIK